MDVTKGFETGVGTFNKEVNFRSQFQKRVWQTK